MRNKWLCLLLAAALTALTAGCSLARPEREAAQEDRWIGFYVVYNPPGSYDNIFNSNPHLTELGTESLDAGKYGSLTIPREVLPGEEDPDTGDIVFPGLEGYSLFIRHKQEDSGYVTAIQSDMSPGEGQTVHSSDEGTAESASGVIWWGPPLDAAADFDPDASPHSIWHGYNVYETSDGQVYLDGTGNSYGGAGSGMGFSSDATYTYTENGETRKDSISVSVSVKYTPRLTALRVVEFDEDNSVVKTTALPLTEELPLLTLESDTAFLVVEEESADGVKRTLYAAGDFTDGAQYHEVILLDEAGRGHGVYLTMEIAS